MHEAGTTVHLTGAGSCTITASQAGDANFIAAADLSQSFTVGRSNQTLTSAHFRTKRLVIRLYRERNYNFRFGGDP